MTYLQWNNSIASHFFRPEYAEQFIYLYSDQETITKIGMESGQFSTTEDAWNDFLLALKSGLEGSVESDDLLKKALSTYHLWKSRPEYFEEKDVDYPYYIAYLILFVVPLTDSTYATKYAGSYYPRFKKFADKWGFRDLRQNENCNWNLLWKDLEFWSFQTMNMDLGIFEDREYSNKSWIYVGKALAQCLLPLKTLRTLGNFFEEAGLTPGENISRNKFRKLLLCYRNGNLQLSPDVVNALQNKEDEKGQTVITIVKQEYNKWLGQTDVQKESGGGISKGWTIARIYSLLEIDEINDHLAFSYRVFSHQDFPDDLSFNGVKCTTQAGNWSRPLKIGAYDENIELKDDFNKWKARLPRKDIRIFVYGSRHNFNGWIESDFLFPGRRMLLLVKSYKTEAVLNWDPMPKELYPLEGFQGLPEQYELLHVNGVLEGHQEIEELALKTELSIQFIGGLSVARRTWLDVILPDILIQGARLDEKVYLEIKATGKLILLERKLRDEPLWHMPDDLPLEESFTVKIKGRKVNGDHIPYKLVDHEICPLGFSEEQLPKRNAFGLLVEADQSTFMAGSHVTGLNYLRQIAYVQYFTSTLKSDMALSKHSNNVLFFSNLLLYYLTIQKQTTARRYFETFEIIFNRMGISVEEWAECPPISMLKRNSLQMLDYLGFIDYEYSNQKIIVNPPQLIFIPSKAGRKLLLIGGRTPELVRNVIQTSKEYDLIPVIAPQKEQNAWYLLPCRIIIHVNGTISYRTICQFAKTCGLLLKEDKALYPPFQFSQYGLLEYSGSIEALETQLELDEEFPGTGWICKIFNPEKLRFEKALESEIEKSYQLVEYKANEYTFLHRLWINGKSYIVNKNWGRYMVLKHFDKHVSFYDRENGLFAVPATVPLPRLLMEGIILCSGFAPLKLWAKIEEYTTYWHIFENVPYNLVFNQFQKLGQKLRETKIPYRHEESHKVLQYD